MNTARIVDILKLHGCMSVIDEYCTNSRYVDVANSEELHGCMSVIDEYRANSYHSLNLIIVEPSAATSSDEY